jgi:hypothetical protein
MPEFVRIKLGNGRAVTTTADYAGPDATVLDEPAINGRGVPFPAADPLKASAKKAANKAAEAWPTNEEAS